jgi:ketosteroid isomerase-like protein
MQSAEAKRYVLDFFAELVAGDGACWDRVADDASWKLMARGRSYPYPTVYTKASYRQLVSESAALFPNGLRFTVLGAIAEGERVAVEAESHGYTRDGQLYANVYHMLVELEDGRIKPVREYLDSGHATEVLRPPAAGPEQRD